MLVFLLLGSHEDKQRIQDQRFSSRTGAHHRVECESQLVVLERNWCALRVLELVSTESVHRPFVSGLDLGLCAEVSPTQLLPST